MYEYHGWATIRESSSIEFSNDKIIGDPFLQRINFHETKACRLPGRPSEFGVINRIFVFQFQYLSRDRTEDVYYMYVTDVNNEQYLKKFESNLGIDIDPYDSTQNELILTKVGVENWRKVLPPELL